MKYDFVGVPVVQQMDGDAYLRWEGAQDARFELHHGFAIAFAGGTLDHNRIALNLCAAFDRHFPPPCRSFSSDVKVKIADSLFYYCDAGLICEPVDGSAVVIERPRIVCEVLSPKTRGYDTVEKRAAYRSLDSLRAYVIVYTDMWRVEVDTRGSGGRWETHWYDEEPAIIDGLVLTPAEAYARTSLADGVV